MITVSVRLTMKVNHQKSTQCQLDTQTTLNLSLRAHTVSFLGWFCLLSWSFLQLTVHIPGITNIWGLYYSLGFTFTASFLYHSVFRSSLQRIGPHYSFPGLLDVPWKYWWMPSQSCSSCILSALKIKTIMITKRSDTSLVNKGTPSNHHYSSFMEIFP